MVAERCRQCGKACPPGWQVTCGNSYCSQIESLENAARAARGRRKLELYAEADKVREQARGPGYTVIANDTSGSDKDHWA